MKWLSIVFQGPCVDSEGEFCPNVLRNITKTRKIFPKAEIVLSTWKGTEAVENLILNRVSNLNVKLVLSKDPGPVVHEDASGKYVLNVNRLLLSSREGLSIASRPISIKLRTDCSLYGRNVIKLLERELLAGLFETPRDSRFAVFKSRVINCNLYARDERGSLPYLFHPGDIMLAGRTEDIRLFFSAPLADGALFKPSYMAGLWCAWRYVPEQWCWVHAIYRATDKWVYNGNFSHTSNALSDSEQWYIANFVPYSKKTLGLTWSKYWRNYPFRGLFSVYTHTRWRRLSAHYNNSEINLSLDKKILDSSLRVLSLIWRIGYYLRAYLLKITFVRSIALRIFIFRR